MKVVWVEANSVWVSAGLHDHLTGGHKLSAATG